MRKIVKIPSELRRVSTLSDGGLSLGFHTREQTLEEQVILMRLVNETGWLLFSTDDVVENEIPEDNSKYESKKPSERLRGVIFRVWERFEKGNEPDFERFYRLQMEKIIQSYKNKLN